MKRLILFLMIALLIPVAAVHAQETLEPGVAIRGEITDDTFEVEYTFSGVAEDVVIIEMLAEDEDGFMNDLTAQVILLSSSGSVVVDTADNFTFSDAILVTQLPADDDYTVIASRENGRSGDTAGEYTLRLNIPAVLTVGDSTEASTTSEAGTAYFVINSEEDFAITYNKSGGDFNPQILISQIATSNSDFEDYASVEGNLNNVTMGDIDAGLYIVQIKEGFFDFYFDEVTADFTLGVQAVAE